jgi:hypothetical protein
MDWLGRVTIAVLVSSIAGFTIGFAMIPNAGPGVVLGMAALSTSVFTMIMACWLLGGRFQDVDPEETRCRKCQYILRGISEPRCPECGERI